MTRSLVVPRPVRMGVAFAGVVGAVTLAGCATGPTAPTDDTTPAPETTVAPTTAPDAGPGAGLYTDGTYTAEGSYATPESVETITVTLTLADDAVTAVEIVGNPLQAESERYQSQFIGGISDEVVGRSVDEISVSRVAGSSLTSGGFNQALEEIRTQAAA